MTRLERWFAAPLAKDIIADEIICSCCNTKNGRHLMRFFYDGPGAICKSCYFNAKKCANPECDEPSIHHSTYCREHFMAEDIDPKMMMLHKVLGSTAVSASYPQHEDGEEWKGRGFTQFKKDLDAAMEREGIDRRDRTWIRRKR
jgi:hypothetical protein